MFFPVLAGSFAMKAYHLADIWFVSSFGTLLLELIFPELAELSEPEAKTKADSHERKAAQPHHDAGWNKFSEHLPREEVVIDLPEEEKQGLRLVDSWIPGKYDYASASGVAAAVSGVQSLDGLPSGAMIPKSS